MKLESPRYLKLDQVLGRVVSHQLCSTLYEHPSCSPYFQSRGAIHESTSLSIRLYQRTQTRSLGYYNWLLSHPPPLSLTSPKNICFPTPFSHHKAKIKSLPSNSWKQNNPNSINIFNINVHVYVILHVLNNNM